MKANKKENKISFPTPVPIKPSYLPTRCKNIWSLLHTPWLKILVFQKTKTLTYFNHFNMEWKSTHKYIGSLCTKDIFFAIILPNKSKWALLHSVDTLGSRWSHSGLEEGLFSPENGSTPTSMPRSTLEKTTLLSLFQALGILFICLLVSDTLTESCAGRKRK